VHFVLTAASFFYALEASSLKFDRPESEWWPLGDEVGTAFIVLAQPGWSLIQSFRVPQSIELPVVLANSLLWGLLITWSFCTFKSLLATLWPGKGCSAASKETRDVAVQ
jgi:hypothetical protein